MPQAISPMALFEASTRRNRVTFATDTFSAEGATKRFDLPQVGLLSRINIFVNVKLTFGASSGTTILEGFPHTLLKSIVLQSNEGAQIYSTNGYTNHLVQRLGMNPINTGLRMNAITGVEKTFPETTGGASCIFNATSLVPGTTVPTSGSFYVAAMYSIPVSVDDSLTAGLLLLQNQSVRASLILQAGVAADWGITAYGTSGGSAAFNVVCEAEYFSIPDDPSAMPDLQWIHRIVSEDVPWTNTGEQIYKVPVNGVILKVIRQYINNGTSQAFFTAVRPDACNFSQVWVKYANTMQPEVTRPEFQLWRQRQLYGAPGLGGDLPDGVFVHEFGLPDGVHQPFRPRDAYDTSNLTEFSVAENCSASPTSAIIRTTRFELQYRSS